MVKESGVCHRKMLSAKGEMIVVVQHQLVNLVDVLLVSYRELVFVALSRWGYILACV